MNRLQQLFQKKRSSILNVYFTAGYPQLESMSVIMQSLQEGGADIIELGMPYSDPLADGPVIQNSSSVALQNGMTLQRLFDQLIPIRKTIHLPIILMGYMNPVLQYGFEAFCRDAAARGVDGLIIPDLPPHEFEIIYQPVMQRYGLDFIFLVTPETSDERIRRLDALSSGFLYAVSSSSTTGTGGKRDHLRSYLERIKALGLKNPVLVGFGIRDRESFQEVCTFADGGIIGTAFIEAISGEGKPEQLTKQFLKKIIG